jgi:hypothetical protein
MERGRADKMGTPVASVFVFGGGARDAVAGGGAGGGAGDGERCRWRRRAMPAVAAF